MLTTATRLREVDAFERPPQFSWQLFRRDARITAGCLDFALSADLIAPGRINVLERRESQAAVEAFRGSGVDGE
jgi:hypothetical protein